MSDAPCITAIKPTKRNPDRATVRVGKRVVGTLLVRSIAQLGLRVGQPWDAQLEEKITSTSVYDKAMRQAMNRLNRRMLSSKRLDDKLRDLGYEPDIRQRVLDRLTELKFIDDEAFGRALIRDITLRKAAGPRKYRRYRPRARTRPAQTSADGQARPCCPQTQALWPTRPQRLHARHHPQCHGTDRRPAARWGR